MITITDKTICKLIRKIAKKSSIKGMGEITVAELLLKRGIRSFNARELREVFRIKEEGYEE